MTRRTTIIVLVLVLAAAFLGYRAVHQSRLAHYQDLIEDRFNDEISLIELEAITFPDEYDDTNYGFVQRKLTEFDTALSDSSIYWATWATDDHHGLMGLKVMRPSGGGLSWGRWHANFSEDKMHSLRYGKAFDGRRLLVYRGHLPDASKRHYMLAFLKDSIDDLEP
jgi:hypothetical protein